ncbi:diguanylate cyclase domain-containing protein [Sphingomonas turrisvirgatae]|uniref:GGDEF domain-containing protein n=1 Tax=Sphingomonas turrisvirgatae TaxID=1888892 RepID=UPI000E5D4426
MKKGTAKWHAAPKVVRRRHIEHRNERVGESSGKPSRIHHQSDAYDVRTICDRVRARFARHVTVAHNGRFVRGTVSGGIATLQPGFSSGDWLLAANQALYAAKASGRNRMSLAA